MPSSRMSSFSTTRRLAVLRGMIAIWTRCSRRSSNATRHEQHQRLGHVALAGPGLVDPVADVGALERAPLDDRQVDLAGEVARRRRSRSRSRCRAGAPAGGRRSGPRTRRGSRPGRAGRASACGSHLVSQSRVPRAGPRARRRSPRRPSGRSSTRRPMSGWRRSGTAETLGLRGWRGAGRRGCRPRTRGTRRSRSGA